MRASKCAGIVICVFMISLLYSQELKEINIVADSWPEITNRDGTGFLFDLIRTVYTSGGITMNYQIVPYARAVSMVLEKSADAWISSGFHEQPSALYPKWHHNIIQNVVIYKKSKVKEWNGPNDFNGKKVCWVRGYDLHKYWEIDTTTFTLVLVNSSIQGLKMMDKDRVDFFVDVDEEIDRDLQSTGLDRTKFAIRPAFVQKLYLAFANNERGMKLRDIWDRQVEEIRTSETMKNIFKKYDKPFAY